MLAAAAAAAAARRRREQEEEEMTLMYTDPSGTIEHKIIRSATGAFKDPIKFRAALFSISAACWSNSCANSSRFVATVLSVVCRAKRRQRAAFSR